MRAAESGGRLCPAQAAGWSESLWFETSVEDPGQGMTREALEAGVDTKTPLALLPSGTGNLLARNLDLTLDDLDHSVHSAFAGKNRSVDLAKMLENTDQDLEAKSDGPEGPCVSSPARP